MRLYITIAVLSAVLALGGVLYLKGRADNARDAELDAARGTIETRERIDNALACSPDANWFDRLSNCTPD